VFASLFHVGSLPRGTHFNGKGTRRQSSRPAAALPRAVIIVAMWRRSACRGPLRAGWSPRFASASTSASDAASHAEWGLKIGLEVHAQIATASKLFSAASTAFGADPNSQAAFVDAALPGTLPVLNEGCVRMAVATALSLNCELHRKSVFERKHYFYADLPHGYQITQQASPIATGGSVELSLPDGEQLSVALERIQLEIDTGQSHHDIVPGMTMVDLNRAGNPLMEIVTAPVLPSAAAAAAFVLELQRTLRHIGACDGNMEQGSMRVDVNVSVAGGERCEVKNLNTVRGVARAIEYEARRQHEALESGEAVPSETRRWDNGAGKTVGMRSKEDAWDYRFMPEPDLPPLLLPAALVEEVREGLGDSLAAVRARLRETHGLSAYDIGVLEARIPPCCAFLK